MRDEAATTGSPDRDGALTKLLEKNIPVEVFTYPTIHPVIQELLTLLPPKPVTTTDAWCIKGLLGNLSL